MEKIRVVFMGTPSFAVPILDALIKEYNVVLVVSQPDALKDRKGNIMPTPVKELAQKNNIKVFQPHKLKDDYKVIIDANPDLIVTCAYGQIVPKELLDYPKYGAINVHGSLLPKLRGGAPIHWALINGEKETGVTVMYMAEKMDAGDIISQSKIKIEDSDNLDILYNKLSLLGRDLLIETIPLIIANKIKPIKQDEKLVTYGYNIKKEEEKINLNNSAFDIHNLIRGLSSTPGAYSFLDGKRVKIYSSEIIDKETKAEPGTIVACDKEGIVIATKDKLLKILDLQIEGKKRCLAKDYLNGIKKEELIGKKFN